MSDVVATLKEARRLIAAGWTKGAYARNVDGYYVDPVSDAAVCFCTVGSLVRANGGIGGEYQGMRLMLARSMFTESTIADWNDSRSDVSEVLTAFDKAIALAEAADA
jgi:hypothetical protein